MHLASTAYTAQYSCRASLTNFLPSCREAEIAARHEVSKLKSAMSLSFRMDGTADEQPLLPVSMRKRNCEVERRVHLQKRHVTPTHARLSSGILFSHRLCAFPVMNDIHESMRANIQHKISEQKPHPLRKVCNSATEVRSNWTMYSADLQRP